MAAKPPINPNNQPHSVAHAPKSKGSLILKSKVGNTPFLPSTPPPILKKPALALSQETSLSPSSGTTDYLALFKEEVHSYLLEMENSLIELQHDLIIEKPWANLRAHFHTIKGSAATLDLPETSILADRGEGLALSALELPDEKTEKSWNVMLGLIKEIAHSLDIPATSLPNSPCSINATLPILTHQLSLIFTILDDWQTKPELPSYQVEFKQGLDKLAYTLQEMKLSEVALNFQRFSTFVESLQSGQFIPPFFIVAKRCLQDLEIYLKEKEINSSLSWTRKWSFYFSSLSVALVADGRRPRTHLSHASQPLENSDPEMTEVFAQEASTHFEQIEAALLAWENGQTTAEQITRVSRGFHTLKGAANSVDLRGLGHGFHLLEDYLGTLNPEQPPSKLFPFLLNCVDQAKNYIKDLSINPSQPWPHDWKHSLSQFRQELEPNPTVQVPVDLDMLSTFIEEAVVIFEQVETAILAWEKLDQEEVQCSNLRRYFHTLKGAANSIELHTLGNSFHILEDFMESVQAKEPPVGLFEFLLKCSDQVRHYIETLSLKPETIWPYHWEYELGDLRKGKIQGASLAALRTNIQTKDEKSGIEERQVVRVEAGKLRQVMHLTSEIIADHGSFEGHLNKLPSILSQWESSGADIFKILQQLELDTTLQQAKSKSNSENKSLGLLLTSLTDISLKLKAQSHLREEFKPLFEFLKEDHVLFRRNSRRLQNDLAALNMAPVSGLFRRLQRVFRDALQEEKKEAILVLEGEQTLLDKAVVDALYGPLLHVVRNAVAHGLESPQRREELQKTRSGTITLTAKPLSNQVIFEVKDDGGGIHESMVRQRAIERGMIPDSAPTLTAEQIVELLFRPGFSTKESVSSVAGRGVGLDVVKAEVESMNGSVTLDYTVGQGSTWTIKVPLTLSASEALVVMVGDMRLALPLSYVQRCVRILPSTQLHRHGLLWHQDEHGTLPCLDLARIFEIQRSSLPSLGVVVDSGLVQGVFLVDKLLLRREIVTKDLGSLVGSLSYLSGATLDPDGSLICILQIPNILQRLAASITESTTQQADLATPQPAPIPVELIEPEFGTAPLTSSLEKKFLIGRPPRVLLCDDSPSVRKVQQKQLAQLGYLSTAVHDGQEALELLQNEDFDLVMTDLEMPRLDGFGLVRSIRSMERFKDLPIIVITSRALERFASETLELGATACLGKPFISSQFERLIHNEEKLSHLRPQTP